MADVGPSSATYPVDVQQICTGRNENSAVQDPEVTECEDKSKSIQAIDKGSVHRICSGQVVLTLATAVKELVENSIDAGATSVEVRLKDYGSESIEVIDNGSGVEEKNFEGLTLKHHTSKLQDFDDLINVTTFGFRGEALSSLCALSNMAITTRNKSAAVGTRLEFDLDGKITVKKSVPRQVGTTVQVQNIFHSLPVRHKEFHRNLKKEFAKLAQVLNAYCIVNTGVRITCSNQTAKGSRSTVVSTNGNEHMKENIANVFGPKQLQSLLAFEQVEAQDDVCSDFGIKPEQKSAINFKIEGFVSKCEHGQGRGSSDRQFIFINRRPCDASKIIKLINEVYHSYNRHQNPFIALNISMNKESVDVNVTPDKRQIFLEGERLLLVVLKTSLIQMFEPTTSVYRVNNFLAPTYSDVKSTGNEKNSPRISYSTLSQIQDGKEQNERNGSSISNTLSRLKRSFSSAYARNDSSPVSAADSPNKKFKSSSPFSMSGARSSSLPSHSNMSDQGSIAQFFSRFSPKKSSTSSSVQSSPVQIVPHDSSDSNQSHCDISVSKTQNDQRHDFSHETSNKFEDKIKETNDKRNNNITLMSETNDSLIEENSVFSDTESTQIAFNDKSNSHIRTNSETHIESQSEVTVSAVENVNNKGDTESVIVVKSHNFDVLNTSKMGKEDEVDGDKEYGERDSQPELENSETAVLTELDFHDIEDREAPKKEKTVSFSLAGLKKKLESCKTKNQESLLLSSSSCGRSFRAKISPGDNQSAEDELKREISKDMFTKMEILGQFNLGFIITKLGSDLFIVDQHATDEKYNFEMLQRDTVLQSQKMIIPQGLELTASNETILVDNLEVFKKNGFDFAVSPEAPPTQRVKLVSAPVSKNWSFGKDDIEELLFMLTDSPNVMCRPTRVRMMFASRACRKSIMIGTALNKSEMRRLVTHMGEIEQPWNCPHGRPTMRHLFNLDMLPTS